MLPPYLSHYTVFAGDHLLVRGSYAEVTRALAAAGNPVAPVLVFDDATGAPVDAPPLPEHAMLLARASGTERAAANTSVPGAQPPSPGRPRLGVVAREVTLLPRHWEWLASQRGGASAALRRLVEQARKSSEFAENLRQSRDRCYKVMSVLAGHRFGFEEAARALFTGQRERFEALIRTWPPDVATHLRQLAAPSWNPAPAPTTESPS